MGFSEFTAVGCDGLVFQTGGRGGGGGEILLVALCWANQYSSGLIGHLARTQTLPILPLSLYARSLEPLSNFQTYLIFSMAPK